MATQNKVLPSPTILAVFITDIFVTKSTYVVRQRWNPTVSRTDSASKSITHKYTVTTDEAFVSEAWPD